jgi:spore maturation protein CgeB
MSPKRAVGWVRTRFIPLDGDPMPNAPRQKRHLLIVGNPSGTHIGNSLVHACDELKIPCSLSDTTRAYAAPWLLRQISWRLRGRRPPRLSAFSRSVADQRDEVNADVVITTGCAPVLAQDLDRMRHTGAIVMNFSSDDPWSPSHRSRWFGAALAHYDVVFTPRRANEPQLRRLLGEGVAYLPFAYDPRWAYPETIPSSERERLDADVLFVGGADRDRVPYVQALASAGITVATLGGYWNRYRKVRQWHRGHATPAEVRQATRSAKVALCLVRRANRDGHVMRTFEIAATGACMLVEDTEEHRSILGPPGEAVTYFSTIDGMVAAAQRLLADEAARARLADAVRQRVTSEPNTYTDRLRTMLEVADAYRRRAEDAERSASATG